MKYKLLLILLVLVLIVPFSFADVYKERENAEISIPCSNAGAYCSGSSVCNITTYYPNGTVLVDNLQMTNQGSYHNYTISSSLISTSGEYPSTVSCCDGADCGMSRFPVKVTPTGTVQSTPNAIASAMYLFLMLGLTALFGFIGFKLVNSDYLWILGLFFIFLAFLTMVYDVWLGFEYHRNLAAMGTSSSMPETIFYIFMFIVAAGFLSSLALLFIHWQKLVSYIKKEVRSREEEKEDDWDGYE